MAYVLPTGTDLNYIEAVNESHRALVALETAKPHYDGPEKTQDRVLQVLSSFYGSAPTTLAGGIDLVEKAISLWDTYHINRHNAGNGLKIYAHKAAGTAIGGTPSAAGSVLEQAMVDAWGPICLELLTTLKNHMLNVGGTWHTAPDLFNSVGTLPGSITTKQDLCSWTIILRSVYEAHRNYDPGVVHSSGDTTNTIAAPPPDNADDWDGILAVLIEMADELEDHVEDGSYHANAMSITPTVAAFPAAVTSAFGRGNTYKAAHNTHAGDTALHHSADSTNTISASNATTVATFLALAAEILTDQEAHFKNAPVSAAVRT